MDRVLMKLNVNDDESPLHHLCGSLFYKKKYTNNNYFNSN